MVEVSSLDVLFLAREFSTLEDRYIDRVYETGPGEFLMRARHSDKGKAAILLRPGQFACLSSEPPETPQSPTSFAGLLRKHLEGSRIRRVEQQEFDRVLVFFLDQRGEPFRLIVELFGKGNLLLVAPDDTIRVVQRTETFRDRTLKVGATFKFPPTRINPVRLSGADFDSICAKAERDVVRFLAMDAGFGPDLAEELLYRAKITKTRKARDLGESERTAIWNTWQGILHGPPQPVVALRNGEARPESIAMGSEKLAGWTRTPVVSVSEAVDQARRRETAAEPVAIDQERERLERQIQAQSESIVGQRKEAEEWHAKAQRLYEHFPEAKAVLKAAADFVAEHGWSKAQTLSEAGQAPPGVTKILAEARRVVVRVGDDEHNVDPLLSLERNASEFFDEAKRVKLKIESAEASVADAKKRLSERQRVAAIPKAAAKVKAPDKRFWFESYRWFYTSEGFLVVGGRDASTNEKLVKKHLNAGDLYFHADVHGAPSCVLKTETKKPGESSIREAAQFAAAFSKAFAQFGSADAYWVKPEQVSKTAESGEFVPRGAFMVRGERNYVPRLPMEVAVGPVRLGKDGRPAPDGSFRRLMGGPRTAVATWSEKPIVVVRGDRKVAEVVKELALRFGVSHDEVQGAVPSGTLKVLAEEVKR